MKYQSLADAVAAHPVPEFANWWPVKEVFVGCAAQAVSEAWRQLPGNSGNLSPVRAIVSEYMERVYQRPLTPGRVEAFAAGAADPLGSGEFDAIYYGFFRSAFEHTQDKPEFTREVGRRFLRQVVSALDLVLPAGLGSDDEFAQLQTALQRVGRFFLEQGYLRTHFAFRFDVARGPGGEEVRQKSNLVVARLAQDRRAYALYEMGYPAIFPSAIYLFYTAGEAPHYSTRMLQAMFEQIGYTARETADFSPSDFSVDLLIELWVIRPQEG